jgi:hypothetical protein
MGKSLGRTPRSETAWNEAAKAAARAARRTDDRQAVEAGLDDCHCGDPPAGLAIDPGWRTAAVRGLVDYLAATHDYAALPVLADALEEAGCDHAVLLNHCRFPVRHVRGCWVVDLLR